MKNYVVLSGRLPMFAPTSYTAGDGDKKKSRIAWAMNVQISSKNEQGYYDESIVYFTAWGYVADQLNQIASLDKNDPMRKEFMNITVTGRLNAGYKDKEGNIVNSITLDVSELEFTKRLSSNNNASDATYSPAARNSNPVNTPMMGGNPMNTNPMNTNPMNTNPMAGGQMSPNPAMRQPAPMMGGNPMANGPMGGPLPSTGTARF